jgi:hypothetical protein
MNKTFWLVRGLFWSAAVLGFAFNLPKYFLLEQVGRESPPPVAMPLVMLRNTLVIHTNEQYLQSDWAKTNYNAN